MSWPYWGIVIGLTVMVIMLIACIRLLSLDDTEKRQRSRQAAGGSPDIHPKPPTIHRRAA
jgi:hypothetical protein